jgi:opacity protein-like surface antigen
VINVLLQVASQSIKGIQVMKRFVIATLLSVFLAAPAVAAPAADEPVGKHSIGVNYGLDEDGVVGIQGEFDISASMINRAPVSAQIFWKNYSHSFSNNLGTYQYNYNGFGAAAIYDFSTVAKFDKRIKPYAGLGLITLNSNLSGPNGQPPEGADTGGLYVTVGVRYALTPILSADLNYNNTGGLTIGANINF